MAYTVEINSVEVSKPHRLRTMESLDKWSGFFELSLRDSAGTFGIAIGNEVVVKNDGTQVWGGYVDKWERRNGWIYCSGLDYTSLLVQIYANEVYTDTLVHNIVSDLMDKYAADATYTNLYTSTTTVEEFRCKNMQLFKILQTLAKYDNCNFFIDKDKDLNFNQLGSTDSGVDLIKGTNIISDKYEVIDDKLVNQVKVTGGREDYRKTETFTADDSTTEFTLTYKPISGRVTVDGTEKTGFKDGMKASADFDYYFDKEAKKLIFNSAPAADGADNISCEYTYTAPIIIISKDDDSVASYGVYEKVIYDETINKKADAQELAAQILAKYSQPFTMGTVKTSLNLTVNLGETVDVQNPNKGINGTFIVVGLEHNFFHGGRTTTYKLAILSNSMVENISDVIQRVEALEELQRGEADLVSYLKSLRDETEADDDPTNNLTAKTRTPGTTGFYFANPPDFDTIATIQFIGGFGKWSANQITNPSS
jgi:hypothetical protein